MTVEIRNPTTGGVTPEKINWTVQEYLGTEVYRNLSDLNANRTLKKEDELVEGQEIVAPALNGWTMARVARDKYGNLYAETEHCIWTLEFSNDDRECWVASGCINKKCMGIFQGPLEKEKR